MIEESQPIDHDSVRFAHAWREEYVEYTLTNPKIDDLEYGFPDRNGAGDFEINIPASGRSGYWGFLDTEHHPEHLVVEYRLKNNEDTQLNRKPFTIPKGRGPRKITIELP